MALNQEEMDARRQKREAMRRKQKRELIRTRFLLAAAALVLIGCIYGIWRMAEAVPEHPEQTMAQSVTETTAPPTEETRPFRNPITTVHIRAAGDLVVTNSTVQAGVAPGGYDFTRAFQDVASELAGADLTVLNLEGNIYGTNYGTQTTCAPANLLTALRNAGVDLIQMANSCAINNGLIGLSSTLNSIRAAGLEPVGAYSSPTEFKREKGYTICTVQGIKVAFVAFTKGIGGMGMPAGNEDCLNLLYVDYADTYRKVDTAGITAILRNVAEEKPDITIALLHWGSENNDTISSTQQSIINLLMKNGVSVILGTHPHLVQEIKFDQAAGTLIAYSLGDFFSDASRGGTNYSIILDLEITRDADLGTTRVTGYSFTPIYTVTETQSIDTFRRVVRIEQAIEAYDGNFVDKVSADCYADMIKSLGRINERTSGKG